MNDLAPVRRALGEDARAEAGRLLAAAQADADAVVAQADREVRAAVDEARRRAAASARARAEQRLAAARREAHRELLEHQERLRETWVRSVHDRLGAMRADARYPALLQRLDELAHEQLGSGAVIERDVDPAGGVIGRSGHRFVDYSLDALADRAIAALDEEATTSWT